MRVAFPASLQPRQRAALHAAAEAAGLDHASAGDGAARAIALGAADAAVVVDAAAELAGGSGSGSGDGSGGDGDGAPSDADLCALLEKHLRFDAAPFFAATAASKPPPPRAAPESAARAAARAAGFGARSADAARAVGLDEFVERTARLLELERAADVAQATEAAAACSPARAQARGRALLNLRLAEAEGGLLGRTLLTLVPNKGFGGPAAPQLPPHKFGPHDVVALRPNSQPPSAAASASASAASSAAAAVDGGGPPPLATGLVYRVREGALIVAVDDMPEEGLEQPLRLEKLANEVTYKRLRATLQLLAAPPTAEQQKRLPGRRLAEYAYGGGGAAPRFAAAEPKWTPVNARLDESQRRAVGLALRAHDFALIHGPPGADRRAGGGGRRGPRKRGRGLLSCLCRTSNQQPRTNPTKHTHVSNAQHDTKHSKQAPARRPPSSS